MKIKLNRYAQCILITLAAVLTFSFMNNTFSMNVANSIVPNITTTTCPQIGYHVYKIPNPSNPVTKMKFNTPPQPSPKEMESWLRLIIHDILGREIAVLVNEQLNPGTYEVEWNADNFSNSVYFYRLIADKKIIETKKMILSK